MVVLHAMGARSVVVVTKWKFTMSKTIEPMTAYARQSSRRAPLSAPAPAGRSSRTDFVRRMADARSARQKVLEDRAPTRPMLLTEEYIIRRAGENSLPNLGAAISKNASAQSDLPSLAPQGSIQASVSEAPPTNLLTWVGYGLLSLLVMGVVALSTIA